MPVSLELCCGTQSFTKVARELGYTNNITLDNDARFAPTILMDIREWDYRRWFAERNMTTVDLVWASCPCTMYSNARKTGPEPDLATADQIAMKCLEIIAYLRPRRWFVENPASSLLKTRPFMQPYNDASR